MSTQPSDLLQRAKILGTLIREGRLAANLSTDECAQAIGVEPETFEAYESGEKAISLPELEALSFFLKLPLEHFWEREPASLRDGSNNLSNVEQLLRIRHRMVGALLRQARLEAGFSLEQLSERVQINADQLEAFELGKEPVPVPELETLSGILHRSIREFHDKHGPVGVWNAQQSALKDFLAMPLELQIFVSRPVNRPYLDLAVRLSDMSVDKLRTVAEGLLEITY
jgi:transcriptional regulator with XRE-family HTH domain